MTKSFFIKMINLGIFLLIFLDVSYGKNYFIRYKHILGSGEFRYEGTTDDNRYFITVYDYKIELFFIQGEKKLFLNSINTDVVIKDLFYSNHSLFISIEDRIIKYDIRSDSFKEEDDKSKKSIKITTKKDKVDKYFYRIGISNSEVRIGEKVLFFESEPLSYCYYTDRKIEFDEKEKSIIEGKHLNFIKILFSNINFESFLFEKKYLKVSEGFIVFYPDIDNFFKNLEEKKYLANDLNTLSFLIKVYPNDKNLLRSLFTVVVKNKDKKRLEALLKEYYNLFTDDQDFNQMLGDFYYNENDYKSAKIYLNRVNSAYSYFLQANIALIEKRLKDAEINYKKSINIDKNFYKSYNNLATMYMEQKKYNLAENLLIEGIKNNINSPSLYYNLGLLYEKSNKVPLALVLYEKAYSLMRVKDEEAYKGEIIDRLYFTYIKLNNLDSAEELIKDRIKNEPNDPVSYYNLGYIYELKKDVKKAVFYYNLFLEMNKEKKNNDLEKKVRENIKKLLKSVKP